MREIEGLLLGLGTDLCKQSRVERLLERFGDRFLTRVFSDQEASEALSLVNYSRRISRLTSAFALKEAMSKALGTGIIRLGVGGSRVGRGVSGSRVGESSGDNGTSCFLPVFWRDIESSRQSSGKPFLRLSNNARVIANRLASRVEGNIACVEVSLSDECGLTHAIVALHSIDHAQLHDGLVPV